MKEVIIYTDGACQGNPGPGGYGVVLMHGAHRKELSGGYRRTTNNRMELMAAIAGLNALKTRCKVTLYTDSKYLCNSITLGWAKGWRARRWVHKDGKRPNWDLWAQLLQICEMHEVKFLWVKGHAGNKENEVCDQLSVVAASRKDLPADEGFEAVPKAPKQGVLM